MKKFLILIIISISCLGFTRYPNTIIEKIPEQHIVVRIEEPKEYFEYIKINNQRVHPDIYIISFLEMMLQTPFTYGSEDGIFWVRLNFNLDEIYPERGIYIK